MWFVRRDTFGPRKLWLTGAGGLALLGLVSAFVFIRWSAIAVAFLCAAGVVGSVHASVAMAQEPLNRAVVRLILRWASAAGAVVLAICGYIAAIGLMTLPLLGVLAATSYVLFPRNTDSLVPQGEQTSLADLSDEDLCLTWRRSTALLQSGRSTEDLEAVSRLRERCLDELERRDPEAFTAWLNATSTTPADPSTYYLHGHESPP